MDSPDLSARVHVLEERQARLAAALAFLLEAIEQGSEKQAASALIETLRKDFET